MREDEWTSRILELEDAAIQQRIAKVKDLMIAAALVAAPPELQRKIVANLSTRRREGVLAAAAEAGTLPPRTRHVGRRVLAKVLLGIDDEETRAATGWGETKPEPSPPPGPKDFRRFLEKMTEKHPDFQRARQERQAAAEAALLRRWLAS